MAGPLAKFITKAVINALTKRGAPSKGEKAALTRAANKAGMPVTEFRDKAKAEIKLADKPPPKPSGDPGKKFPGGAKPLTDKGSTKGLTKKQKSERQKLIAQSKASERKAKLERQGITPTVEEPERIQITAGGTQVLPSKEQIDPKIRNYSKARIRHLIKTGQAKMVIDKNGKRKIVTTGKFASPRSMVAKEMGLGDRGVTPSGEETEKEIKKIGGFQIRKSGGTVKRNKGGAVRGVGQATKGFGNATYSKKMY